MPTAYCDDSGDAQVATVAGYLSETDGWQRFDADWRSTLKGNDVAILHRNHLEHLIGEFSRERGWTPERRTELLQVLHSIIHEHTTVAVGASVVLADFATVVPVELASRIGGPFGFCAYDCLRMGLKWSRDTRSDGPPIRWIFERGTKGAGQIGQMLDQVARDVGFARAAGIAPGAWTFGPKDLAPLQAADVLAYEMFKHVRSQIVDGGVVPQRMSARTLIRTHEQEYMRYWTAPYLQRWVVGVSPFLPE